MSDTTAASDTPVLRRELLQELLWACGPCGQEEAVRDICARELAPLVDEMSLDGAGNLVGLTRGENAGDHPPMRILAHLDELSMVVKRIRPDGILHLSPLGTMYPGNFGLGPVTVLGRHDTVTGVLTLGSEHTTAESEQIWQTKPDGGDKALDWTHVYVFTGRSDAELAAAGVRPGTRVCVDRTKRTLVEFGEFLGCYFMDDRAALVALIETAERLGAHPRPPGDTYLVFTAEEEIGGVGGSISPEPRAPCPTGSRSPSRSGPPKPSTARQCTRARWSRTATRCASTTRPSPTG